MAKGELGAEVFEPRCKPRGILCVLLLKGWGLRPKNHSVNSMDKEKTYSLYETKGQLRVTIPRVLAQTFGIEKCGRVKWNIDRGELILRRIWLDLE